MKHRWKRIWVRRGLALLLAAALGTGTLTVSAVEDGQSTDLSTPGPLEEQILPTEVPPMETVPIETIPAETLPTETLPAETIPAETLSTEPLPTQVSPTEAPPEEEPTQPLPAEQPVVQASQVLMQTREADDGIATYASGGYVLNQKWYNSRSKVYWDVATAQKKSYGDNYQERVTSVTVSGVQVTRANSSSSSRNWSNGTPITSLYPGASTTEETSAVVQITPAQGYYVSRVTVACCGMGDQSPYQCNTWSAGNAVDQPMALSDSSEDLTLSFDLSSKAFCHSSESGNYFILIQVAPVPTPLYVEYDCGQIVEWGAEGGIFADPDGWTAAGSNAYGTGRVDTPDTQFRYCYEGSPSDTAQWKHYANTITQAAREAAGAAGYYFTGWAAEYYTTATVTPSSDGSNNYTYQFDDLYAQKNYAPGDAVHLVTNVRLTAQWAPLRLTVRKTVTGLANIPEHNGAHTYTLLVYKEGVQAPIATLEIPITGDGQESRTLASVGADVCVPISPGVYRVVESGTYHFTGAETIAQCTVSYNTQTVTVAAGGEPVLEVTNSYRATPATRNLTVYKTVSGNMSDPEEYFDFFVTVDGATSPYRLCHGGSTGSIPVPVGAQVTISETAGAYTFSVAAITPATEYTTSGNALSFTMPQSDVAVTVNNDLNVLIDTGLTCDTGPAVLILTVTATMAALVPRRRRRKE